MREHTLDLPGRLPPERHRDLGHALDRVLATDGTLEGDGDGFLWGEDHRQGRTRISVVDSPTGGTRVTVRADRRGWAAALNLVGLAAGVAAGAATVPITGHALVAVGAGLGVWWGLVGLVWRPYGRRVRRRLEAAVVEVAARLEEEERGSRGSPGPGS